MFGLQPLHLFVILIIALIIFGPSRLPEIGRAVGKSIREFRMATEGAQEEVRKGLDAKPEVKPESKPELPKTDG